ncbi:hypothetical protein EG240_01725 [Paenimyroides tangerinum]|uniref:Uncharacterized protein n=1 Tax=Paenimyroides tangerinum TaxID=2488728 RepID=A0A3P3WCI0_9FLAO|nr:hypothetical protein [Paenimyroides tangerinum]RRJ92760.1 hypothetical protein EG240_01725 [Paenimyroides tangerinum]
MVAYFDLENLESFLKQPKDDFYHDCLKLIKKQLDLSFNFNKEDFKKSEDLMNFIKLLSDGVGDKVIKYIPEKFPARDIKSNSHKNFSIDELLSVYFINNSDLNKLKEKDDLLIADIGEEIGMFKTLFLKNDDYKFELKLRIGEEFSSWKIFKNFQTSHTDIIIVDNYILTDKSLIPTNLNGIIDNSLVDNCRKILNIVIFVKGDQMNIDYTELKTSISVLVKAKYVDSPNVTIIKHYVEHDRTILRNLLRIYSGDTFNYFLANGNKITRGKEIHFASIADKNNYKLYKNTLSDLQTIVNNAVAGNIIGDKKSRFINFS